MVVPLNLAPSLTNLNGLVKQAKSSVVVKNLPVSASGSCPLRTTSPSRLAYDDP